MAQLPSRAGGFQPGAAFWAGIIGGVVALALEMLLVWALQLGSVWAPMRRLAGVVLGPEAMRPAGVFDARVFVTALVVSLVLGVLYALAITALTHRMRPVLVGAAGLVLGAGVYAVDHYVFAVAFPALASLQHWSMLLARMVFGLVVASAYEALAVSRVESRRLREVQRLRSAA